MATGVHGIIAFWTGTVSNPLHLSMRSLHRQYIEPHLIIFQDNIVEIHFQGGNFPQSESQLKQIKRASFNSYVPSAISKQENGSFEFPFWDFNLADLHFIGV